VVTQSRSDSLDLLKSFTAALCAQWEGTSVSWHTCTGPQHHTLVIEKDNLTLMFQYGDANIGHPDSAEFEQAMDQIMENFVRLFGPMHRMH
jgi:hypothetical protein